MPDTFWEAARVLAGAADRDVDLRAHVDSRFEQFDRGFQQVDRGFIEMRGKLDATAAGQQRIVELIESLIDQQNR